LLGELDAGIAVIVGIEAREDVLRGGGLGLARKVNNAHSSAAYTCHRDGMLLLLLLHVLF
jgi:hypothetical protein